MIEDEFDETANSASRRLVDTQQEAPAAEAKPSVNLLDVYKSQLDDASDPALSYEKNHP